MTGRIPARIRAAALAMAISSTAAAAQVCTATMTDFDFGTVSVRDGSQPRIMGQLEVDCAALLGLVTLVNVCLDFGPGDGGAGPSNNPRHMRGPGGEVLAYQLYRNSYGGTPLTAISGISIGLLSGTTHRETIYAQILGSGAAVNGGHYESGFAGASDFSMTAGVLFSCTSRGQQETVPFTVQAQIVPECTVSAGTLDFGTLGTSISAPVTAQATISVTCSAGAPYTVLLGTGQGAGVSDPTARKMTASGGATLTYGLYRDQARTAPWGWNAGSNGQGGTGTGSVQSITVHGEIPAGQNVPTGVYDDSVVITVNY